MRILLTNDDGIGAPGLWAVAAELAKVGDLVVAAPGEERSGAGTSISLRKPIRVQEVAPQVDGVKAFSVSGTPADSAILAISCLFPGEFDLVVSGINRGSNLGHDVYVSGTVGAAMRPIPSGRSVSRRAESAMNVRLSAGACSGGPVRQTHVDRDFRPHYRWRWQSVIDRCCDPANTPRTKSAMCPR